MSRRLLEEALAAEGVSGKLADLAFSIYSQESSAGTNTKTSNRGAVGGMQVLPGTFKEVADSGWDIQDPLQNARAGIRYLKKLDKLSGGNPALTAAGYYGGPGGLEKARRGIAVSDPKNPNAPNTLQYGQQVVGRIPGGSGAVQAVSQPAPVGRRPDGSTQFTGDVGPGPGDPGIGKSGMPLPPELLRYLTARSSPAPLPAAKNAWLSFLDSMRPVERKVSGAPAAPIQVQDIDWAQAFRAPPPAMPVQRVDFSPFAGFGMLGNRG